MRAEFDALLSKNRVAANSVDSLTRQLDSLQKRYDSLLKSHQDTLTLNGALRSDKEHALSSVARLELAQQSLQASTLSQATDPEGHGNNSANITICITLTDDDGDFDVAKGGVNLNTDVTNSQQLTGSNERSEIQGPAASGQTGDFPIDVKDSQMAQNNARNNSAVAGPLPETSSPAVPDSGDVGAVEE